MILGVDSGGSESEDIKVEDEEIALGSKYS